VGRKSVLAALVAVFFSGCVSQHQSLPEDGEIFADCAECPAMVVIPPGDFAMGADESQARQMGVYGKTAARERPVHTVRIRHRFAVSRAQVSRELYASFLMQTGYEPSSGCYGWRVKPGGWEFHAEQNWQSPGFAQTDDEPVVCVSWEEAQKFVQWLSVETGLSYRLLTEAEWEYAARGGVALARYWGDEPELSCGFANVYDRSAALMAGNQQSSGVGFRFECDDGFPFTSPAGSFPPNDYGLYDMLGNVWEWTEDCFNWNYEGAPSDGSAWLAGDCTERTVRGGSSANDPQSMRVTERGKNPPTDKYVVLGFRVARDL